MCGTVFNAPFYGLTDNELVELAILNGQPNNAANIGYLVTGTEDGPVYTSVHYECWLKAVIS